MYSNSYSKLYFTFWAWSDYNKANAVGENSSFIFTVCVKFVPLYHFKLARVFLHTAVKELLKPIYKNGEIGRFNVESHTILFSSIILKLMKWFINQ